MWTSIPDLPNRLASASIAQYNKLPKTGKPVSHGVKAEWTVLACILAVYAGKYHQDTFSWDIHFTYRKQRQL